ncbi:MAG TPA: DUF6263 family protein [Prolixibacteraceae bacterium]|jgi:hypothetical protein
MKIKLIVLFVVSLLMSAQIVDAKSKVFLRFNLQKGSNYEMTMAMTNNVDQEMMGHPFKMDQKMEMVFLYNVLDVLPNKNYLVEYSLQGMKLDMNINDQVVHMDSKDTAQSNPMNASIKGFLAAKLKLELNSKGGVERVEGMEEYTKNLSQNPQMAQSMRMFSDEKSFKSFISQSFYYFPEKEVEEGDKWTSSFELPGMMNMETTMNFEVATIEKDQVILNVSSDVNIDSPVEQQGIKIDMKMTGTQTGSMTIDRSDGWLRTSDLTQKFDMHMKMKNPQSGEEMEIPMLMNSVAKVTVVKN